MAGRKPGHFVWARPQRDVGGTLSDAHPLRHIAKTPSGGTKAIGSVTPLQEDERLGRDDGATGATPDALGLWAHAPWIVAIGVLSAIAIAWAFLPLQYWVQSFGAWVRSFGAAGALAFAAVYIVATLLLVPGAAMTIAGALAFGWWSLPLVLISATIGATLAFLASRYFFHGPVSRAIESRPRMAAIVEAVDEEKWLALTLLRLSPVIPFNVQNYLLGVTNVATGAYFASTLTGMLPGTLLGTYIGVLGRVAGEGEISLLQWGFLALGLAATLAVVVMISRRARQKLATRLPASRSAAGAA